MLEDGDGLGTGYVMRRDAEPDHAARVVGHHLRRAAVGDAVVLPPRHAGVRLRHQRDALVRRRRHLADDPLDLRRAVAAVRADDADAPAGDRIAMPRRLHPRDSTIAP